MYRYTPNEVIVDRAVELWKRVLSSPTFDNGGGNIESLFAGALASKLAESSKATPEKLEEFGKHLKYFLMNELSFEEIEGKPEKENSHKFIHNSLSVDYNPDSLLASAATRAGLSLNIFPWKTSMHLYDTYLGFGVGYCAPWEYHYPLTGGRWLITKLTGEDIGKVIEYAEGGTPLFEIESPLV